MKEINWLLKEKYQGKETDKFFFDVKRIKKGEPIDYIIGFSDFLKCRVDLSRKPFIPRAETEFWVGRLIEEIKQGNKQGNVLTCLDLCAGSGCIGTAMLKNLSFCQIYFAEKETKFVKQIRKNLRLNNISSSRFKIFQSDLFKNIGIKTKFDYIVANPPYISLRKKSLVQKSVINWEPRQALFAKDNGLFFIKKIIMESPEYLNSTGKLFIEFDSWQKKEIARLVKKSRYSKVEFWKDQYQRWRMVVLGGRI